MEEWRLIELNLKRLGGFDGSRYMQAAQMRYRTRRISGFALQQRHGDAKGSKGPGVTDGN